MIRQRLQQRAIHCQFDRRSKPALPVSGSEKNRRLGTVGLHYTHYELYMDRRVKRLRRCQFSRTYHTVYYIYCIGVVSRESKNCNLDLISVRCIRTWSGVASLCIVLSNVCSFPRCMRTSIVISPIKRLK